LTPSGKTTAPPLVPPSLPKSNATQPNQPANTRASTDHATALPMAALA